MFEHLPKKILMLAANPTNTVTLRLDEEVRRIEEALRRARKRDSFVIEQRWAVRIDDLRRALLDADPQIVHFSGHGEADGIVLETENGQAQLVNPKALSQLFSLFTEKIECVLLNACYSAVQAEAIGQYIDYVIGMNRPISDQAAMKFSEGFYDALGAARNYEDAYRFGCNAIQLADLSEHETPILHARSSQRRSLQYGQKENSKKEPEQSSEALQVFYSYSQEDEELRDSLEKYLVMLKRQGLIGTWHDRDIRAGSDWKEATDTHLNSAHIILLLVSPNFLASDYAYETEMQRAMERHRLREARVIPVILRPCEWQEAPFNKLEPLPTNRKPITTWADQDEAFLAVAQGIRSAINAMRRSDHRT